VSFSPVSLTPAINKSTVSSTLVIIENTCQGLITGVVATGEQLTELTADVVATGDKYSFANISANF
jgi:hypothetical protein